ncbi:Uma2 family endonuclease [Nitrosophilus labii]|uniref:Uma2 family endonuclease n=1 Tax=Nitrosophilus labii TaxID=2706014 RepID=UPI0016571CB3|nr:Uma2 family endonuclease [Nitrosophilus labii]
MSINPPKYAYEDYKLWQGDWELIEGYPFAMSLSPSGKHQKLMSKLLRVFDEELENCECDVYPKLDWIVDEKNVVRPDLAIYCEDIEEYPKTTPKIIIEIVSKSSATKDEDIKFELYAKEGVKYYIF